MKMTDFNQRIESRRSQGFPHVVDYIYGLVKHNNVPLETLNLTPEEHAAFQERQRIEQEQAAEEAARAEEQARRYKLYMEKREAEFQAQLVKMKAANLPTEHTVDAVRYDGELRGALSSTPTRC
jgi:regulator of protease activity HflC (stomatin/prohibitin superfamily)